MCVGDAADLLEESKAVKKESPVKSPRGRGRVPKKSQNESPRESANQKSSGF